MAEKENKDMDEVLDEINSALNDIKGIISQCKELDMNYIRSRSKEMKTYPKLVKLLNEIKQRKLKIKKRIKFLISNLKCPNCLAFPFINN